MAAGIGALVQSGAALDFVLNPSRGCPNYGLLRTHKRMLNLIHTMFD